MSPPCASKGISEIYAPREVSYVESLQYLRKRSDVRQQCQPLQPQDQARLQSQCAEGLLCQGRQGRDGLRLRTLLEERQGRSRLTPRARPSFFSEESAAAFIAPEELCIRTALFCCSFFLCINRIISYSPHQKHYGLHPFAPFWHNDQKTSVHTFLAEQTKNIRSHLFDTAEKNIRSRFFGTATKNIRSHLFDTATKKHPFAPFCTADKKHPHANIEHAQYKNGNVYLTFPFFLFITFHCFSSLFF